MICDVCGGRAHNRMGIACPSCSGAGYLPDPPSARRRTAGPATRPRAGRLRGALGLGLVGIIAWTVLNHEEAPGPALEPRAAPDPATDWGFAVGDCLMVAPGTSPAEVGCTQPHTHEVFRLVGVEAPAGAPYPGPDELQTFSDDQCHPHFDAYLGAAAGDTRWEQAPIVPSPSTWHAGRREVVCTVVPSIGQPVREPARPG
jgi:hypothetical protein